ncbi:sugar ABC transporter permease [Micromonospora sp. NPDC049559]|uniref:carbohydrate ABC transporter permease n=1 Tax=Micromonospora sp. NPDC049559 TaxID=3155923 RepID=UPI0034442320
MPDTTTSAPLAVPAAPVVGTAAARPEPAGRRRSARARWAGLAFVLPAWLYVVAFYLYPLLGNVRMSLRDYTVRSFYTGVAPFVGWQNHRLVWADDAFAGTVRNTVLFTVGSLFFQFSIGLALAVFFRRRFPLGGLLRSLLLVPWLLPLVVSGTAWRWILETDSGVLNQTLLGLHLVDQPVPWLASTDHALLSVTLVNIWVGIPFNMVILYGGLQAVPEHLYEAASLDGAGPWQRFWRITFPLLRPVTAVVLTLGLIYTLKVFDVIMVLTQGGPADSSQTLTTYAYDLSFQQLAFGRGAAVGNLLILVAVVFAFVYLRATRDGGSRDGGSRDGGSRARAAGRAR